MTRFLPLWALLFCPQSPAHHSYSMFDTDRKLTVSGTIATVEWSNPHIFVWVYVARAGGGHDLFAFQSGSINSLQRLGWSKHTLAVGDKVTIEFCPLKDGRNGGALVDATRADGTTVHGDGVPGTAAPAASASAP